MRKHHIPFYVVGASLIAVGAFFIIHFFGKYNTSDTMSVAIEEVRTSDYPEDPSHRSIRYDQYGGRRLILTKKDSTHFDFVFASDDPQIATITISNVDLALFIPRIPEWVKGNPDLEIISLVEREWNRQQVGFSADSPQVAIVGGDGFEKKGLYTAELTRNCLNAGLWEIIFTTQEGGRKAIYYQGWFTFPLGHYKQMFEDLNGVSYWSHWSRLEHWRNPQGAFVALAKLRTVVAEAESTAAIDHEEPLLIKGEQERKRRTFDASQVRNWGDICRKCKIIRFATFRPPGRYSVAHPWGNELERITRLDKVIVRTVRTSPKKEPLHEIEMVFSDVQTDQASRFLIGGVDLKSLPRLPTDRYDNGLYMPMGIGVGPSTKTTTPLKRNLHTNLPTIACLSTAATDGSTTMLSPSTAP